jgi:hypothetical protein
MIFGRLDVNAQKGPAIYPREYYGAQIIYEEETKTLTVSGNGEWAETAENYENYYYRWPLDESFYDSTGKEVPLEDVEVVEIQEGVKKIGRRACYNFSSLKKVSVPSTVSEIDPTAFYGAERITDFQVSEDNSYYQMSGGCLYQVQKKQLVLCPYKQMKKIQIKASTKEICELAFSDCTELKKITIPKNVRLIHEAFSGCTGLERVTFAKDSKCQAMIWGDADDCDGVVSDPPYAGMFRGCEKLTSITFPDSLRYLGEQVFYQSNIQEVYLGESFMGFVYDLDYVPHDLSELNQWIFSEKKNQNYETCKALRTISEFFYKQHIVEVSLKSIQVSAKNKYFSSKDGVLYNKTGDTLLYYPSDKKGSRFTLPDKVTKLDKCCLTGNKYLKKIISKNKVKVEQPSYWYRSAYWKKAVKKQTLDHEISFRMI